MILVSPLEMMAAAVATHRPSHLVSLLDPGHAVTTPPEVAPGHHLKLGLHDISEPFPGYTAPEAVHVSALLDFEEAWDRTAPLLVHCFAGVSRSMAAALIVLARRNPGREREVAAFVRSRAPHAWPNRRMIALADELMTLDGALVDAVEGMPAPQLTPLGTLVSLPVDL